MKASEKVWLAIAACLVLLAAAAPYIAGWLSAPPGQPFTGILIAREDGFSYLAKMRLGAGGGWLYHDMYATEANPDTPLFSIFIALGHIAAPGVDARIPLTSLSVVFSLARLTFGAVFLVVLYVFIAVFVNEISQRRLAWVLIVAGGGLGWLLLLLTGDALPFGSPPLDLYLGEANSIVPLLAYPHTLLARAALLGGALCLMRADERGDWRWATAAAGLWLIATLSVPFDILIAGGLVGGWIAARWLMTRRFPLLLVLMGLTAGIPGAGLNAITLAMIGSDPVYAAWTAQNLLPLPHILHLLSAFGLQAALAIPGAVYLWRSKAPRADLLIGWVAAAPLLTLIPLPFQLRFIEGFTIPLDILAITGLARIVTGRARLAAVIVLFVVVLPTSLFLVGGGIGAALGGFGRLNADQTAALEWLRTRAEADSVVLSSDEFGVMAPAAAPLRVVLGHGFETPDFEVTKVMVASLYSGELGGEAARDWLGSHHVRYVVIGPDELALAGGERSPLVDDPALREVFAQGVYHIYEMREP